MLDICTMANRRSVRWSLAACFGLSLGMNAQAAAAAGYSAPVPELRLYPSGQIVGLGLQRDWGDSDRGDLALLYNRARRGSNGRHDDERGDGFGVGASYERFWAADRLGWSVQGRTDVFALRIDYRDGPDRGQSDITVLQPTIGAGYTVPISSSSWTVRFGLDLGAEINVRTRGAAVGSGAILLLGIGIAPR